jgi:hypothetical protein
MDRPYGTQLSFYFFRRRILIRRYKMDRGYTSHKFIGSNVFQWVILPDKRNYLHF